MSCGIDLDKKIVREALLTCHQPNSGMVLGRALFCGLVVALASTCVVPVGYVIRAAMDDCVTFQMQAMLFVAFSGESAERLTRASRPNSAMKAVVIPPTVAAINLCAATRFAMVGVSGFSDLQRGNYSLFVCPM